MKRLLLALAATLFAVTALAQDEAEAPVLPPAVTDPATPVAELTQRLIPLTADELAAAAAEWLAVVKAKTEEVVEAQIAAGGEGAQADAARERLVELTGERKALFDAYTTVVDSWQKKGGDEAAIAQYRAYRNAIVVEETRTADFETLMNQALAWAISREGGVQLAIDIAVIVVSFLGLLIVARLVRRLARGWFGKVPNLSKLLQSFLSMAIYWVVLSIGFLVVLSAIGIDISPVFALFGGAAFIFAFALQDTLGNLAAGVMIMLNRPFDEGDYVDIAGTAGTVKAVNVSSTTVTTPDNQIIVIPNKNVWGNTITNVTTSPTRRVDLTFGIGYDDSIEKAQAVLERLVAAHPLIMDDPAPVIRVGALGASSVDFIVRPWVKGGDYWTVYWDLTRQVKEAFDAEGISIPYPQQDVHVRALPAQEKAAGGGVSAPSETVSRGEEPVARHNEGADG
jgi:small conductance mechanosensitive channel